MSMVHRGNLSPPAAYKNIGKMTLTLQCLGSWVCGFEMKWAWHLRDTRHTRGPRMPGSTSAQHTWGDGGPEEWLVQGDQQTRAQSGSSRPKGAPNSPQSDGEPTAGWPARASHHRYSRTVSSFRVKPREVGFRSWLSSSLSCRDTKSLPSA